MRHAAVPIGVLLIAFTLTDVFKTVLYYDDVGFLSKRLYRVVWEVLRWSGSWRREAPRPRVLALGVPLMIVGTLALWLGLIVTGFGFLYYWGLQAGQFSSGGLPLDLVTGLYLSAVSVSTLGYGDVTPVTTLFKLVTSLQAMTGLTIIALGVSYVLNINQVVRQISVFGGHLRNESGGAEARSLLIPHFRMGEPRGLGDRLYQLHESLLAHYEGVRHYPIVYFFFSHRSHASTPYIFRSVGDVVAALRWGLPGDHPAAMDPWLPTLVQDYVTITRHISESFNLDVGGSPPQPVGLEEFEAEMKASLRRGDPWLQRFLALNDWMGDVARLPTTGSALEAYARYKGWLPFAHLVESFVRSTGEDLGHLRAEVEA